MGSGKGDESVLDLGDLKHKKTICLTLDIEQDHADLLAEPRYEGLGHIPKLVDFFRERDTPITCFVQGALLESHPKEIGQLFSLNVEFGLHSYSHPIPQKRNFELEIDRGKKAYRQFFSKDPIGYRAPLGVIQESEYEVLASNGFRFDSSVFPSLRPGVFNNLGKPTKPYLVGGHKIVEFPFGVLSDRIRVPMSLSYIKLLGKPFLYLMKTFHLPNLIVFGFHMHDLFRLHSSNEIAIDKYPFIYRTVFRKVYLGNKDGLSVLDEVIQLFRKKDYEFLRLADVYEAICRNSALA